MSLKRGRMKEVSVGRAKRHKPKILRDRNKQRLEPDSAGRLRIIPKDTDQANIVLDGNKVMLTHLTKIFWPGLRITKRDLLQYYLEVSTWLLPHLRDRAMVMKRYPNGIAGDFFFMKRAPTPRPDWVQTCSIEHHSGNVIDFPVVENVASLLWVVNLGCIDLNPGHRVAKMLTAPIICSSISILCQAVRFA